MSSEIEAICASRDEYSPSSKSNSLLNFKIVGGALPSIGPLCFTNPSKVSHVRFNPSKSKYFFSNK